SPARRDQGGGGQRGVDAPGVTVAPPRPPAVSPRLTGPSLFVPPPPTPIDRIERVVMTTTDPRRVSPVSAALARDRLGVPAVVFFVMSGVAPLTVAAGVVPTAYAATGLRGIPAAFIVVAVILGVFSVGYVAMARHITNGRVGRRARYQPRLALFRAAPRRTGYDSFLVVRLSSD